MTLRKAIIRKTAEQEGGVELCSRIFELVIQNTFVNGKYCVCNSKLLPLEEKSNIREAYFNKAELAGTVLPLLQGLDKMYHVVWLDSGHYCLTNLV